MKRIPFEQMIMGLDDLFFHRPLNSIQEAIDRTETIEAYLEATGYTWDDILDHILAEELPYEEAQQVSTRIGRPGIS